MEKRPSVFWRTGHSLWCSHSVKEVIYWGDGSSIVDLLWEGKGVKYLIRREVSLLRVSICIHDLLCKDEIELLPWYWFILCKPRRDSSQLHDDGWALKDDGHFQPSSVTLLLMSLFSSGLVGGGVLFQEKEGKGGGRRKLERQISALVQISLGLFLKALVKADSR